jgi:hypothetical protein
LRRNGRGPGATYVATSRNGTSTVVSHKKGGSGGRTVKVDSRMKADKRGKAAAEKRKAGKRSNKRRRRR